MERHYFTPAERTTTSVGHALIAWGVSLAGVAALALMIGLPADPWAVPWLIAVQLIAPWLAVVMSGGMS